jgi:hypothetical protein
MMGILSSLTTLTKSAVNFLPNVVLLKLYGDSIKAEGIIKERKH